MMSNVRNVRNELAYKELVERFKIEVASALSEGRQPRCINCGEPLEVRQLEDISVSYYWCWDEKASAYKKTDKSDYVESDPTQCARCNFIFDFIADQIAVWAKDDGLAKMRYQIGLCH